MDHKIKMDMHKMEIEVTKSCHFWHVWTMHLASKLQSVQSRIQNFDPPAMETNV